MAGNVRLDNRSRGVHDNIYCNILILSDNTTKVCLLGFDLIGLEYKTCIDIKERIEKATNIPAANIVMWATHTHSGPDTGMRMYQGAEDSINAYIEKMAVAVTDGVTEANKKYEEVILKSGKTKVPDLNFNRRLVKKDGSVVMNFEDFKLNDIIGTTGPVDNELITLSVWDKNDRLFALLVNFTLHPAILVGYKWLISRDFINYLDEYISDNYNDQVVTLFANGAEGNINHLNYQKPSQLRSFEEAEKVGRQLGTYVKYSINDSSLLDGKIRFISENVSIPLRGITEDEKQWADMVLVRDKNIAEDMFDGIPDKTYARMIKGMIARADKKCETVLQGLAIHNFAFVTFPGEVYVEFGIRVKELSPYPTTMVIGLANSQFGYIPVKEAFSQGGYEVRTDWMSQLVYDAGDILVDLINEKILNNLSAQSVKVTEKMSSDNNYRHKDFHIAFNLLISYIYIHFGKDSMIEYLKQFSKAYFKPLNQKLKTGDKEALVSYFKDIYEKEEWSADIICCENSVEITQTACPAISHIIKQGGRPCPQYYETYNTVYKTICEETPFEYSLEYFDDETGACRQMFIIREEKR